MITGSFTALLFVPPRAYMYTYNLCVSYEHCALVVLCIIIIIIIIIII